jgi:acyl-coenzyme A thioesterase PaaI-like protein
VDDEGASALADEIERLVVRLDAQPRRDGKVPGVPTSLDDVQSVFGNDPVIGLSNPIAPPVQVDIVDGVVHGAATFGRPYEGPPGHVHGAVIAAAFDMLLGLANLASGNAGMTGTLTIRYRSPTPLNTEVRFVAGFDHSERRKTFILGTAHAGDVLVAEAEGVFVGFAPHHAKMFENLG